MDFAGDPAFAYFDLALAAFDPEFACAVVDLDAVAIAPDGQVYL